MDSSPRAVELSSAKLDHGEPPRLCRPAYGCDRPAIMTLLAATGESEDDVPRVWDSWLTGGQGLLAVGQRQAQIVVQGHLMDLGRGEWWLEGLRIRSETLGQGVGSHFHGYLVDQWLRSAGRVVRLATNIERRAVHRMCQRTRFERVTSFVRLEMDALPAQAS